MPPSGGVFKIKIMNHKEFLVKILDKSNITLRKDDVDLLANNIKEELNLLTNKYNKKNSEGKVGDTFLIWLEDEEKSIKVECKGIIQHVLEDKYIVKWISKRKVTSAVVFKSFMNSKGTIIPRKSFLTKLKELFIF